MTTNHKLKESIAVCLVIGILAFVAGAENYFSGMEYQYYSTQEFGGLHQASFEFQKTNTQALRDSTIAVRKSVEKITTRR
jgi:hypothetical protein